MKQYVILSEAKNPCGYKCTVELHPKRFFTMRWFVQHDRQSMHAQQRLDS